MANLNIEEIEKVYNLCKSVSITKYTVESNDFRNYCKVLSDVEKELGEANQEDDIRKITQFYRWFRYDVSVTPMPPSWLANDRGNLNIKNTELLNIITYSYPQYNGLLQHLDEVYQAFSKLNENPLFSQMQQIISEAQNKNIALVILNNPLADLTEKYLHDKQINNVEVAVPRLLKGNDFYDAVIIFGPCFMYPEYIFNSPRAEAIHSVRYAWLPDNWKPKPYFIGHHAQTSKSQIELRTKSSDVHNEEWLDITIEDSGNDWKEAIEKVRGNATNDGIEEEAKLFVLETGYLLPLAEDSRLLVIDLVNFDNSKESENDYDRQWLKYMYAKDIEPGMLVINRTEGSGKSLVDLLAIHIMGKQANQRYEMQDEWKNKLSGAIRKKGIDYVVNQIKRLGGATASDVNVTHWMSYKNIKPQKYLDFQAIMRFIGMEQRTRDLWQNASEITKAHLKAGSEIRKRLIREVLKTNLKTLGRKDRIDFKLDLSDAMINYGDETIKSTLDSGMLSAFRVHEVIEGTRKLPSEQIGSLISLQEK